MLHFCEAEFKYSMSDNNQPGYVNDLEAGGLNKPRTLAG
jgi:hypothetical protein